MTQDFAIAQPSQYRFRPLFSGISDPFAGYGRQVTGNCCQVLGDRYPLFAGGYVAGRKSPDSWNGRGPTLADQAVCRPGLGYAPQPGPKPSSACANAIEIIAESAVGNTIHAIPEHQLASHHSQGELLHQVLRARSCFDLPHGAHHET